MTSLPFNEAQKVVAESFSAGAAHGPRRRKPQWVGSMLKHLTSAVVAAAAAAWGVRGTMDKSDSRIGALEQQVKDVATSVDREQSGIDRLNDRVDSLLEGAHK